MLHAPLPPQSVALMYTVLKQGIEKGPTAKRVIVVCPTSLVVNWAKGECERENGMRSHLQYMAVRMSRDTLSTTCSFL